MFELLEESIFWYVLWGSLLVSAVIEIILFKKRRSKKIAARKTLFQGKEPND